MLEKIRDPISCLTHMAGAVAALVCTVALVYQACPYGPGYVFPMLVFGLSLVLLYSASTAYHMPYAQEKTLRILRRIDHSMIFCFIAGTYTPVCLIALQGTEGLVMLAVVWSLAIAGCLMKIFWLQAPRFVSTFIYVAMGWIVLFAFYPLAKAVPASSLALLVAGGIAYTTGAVVYATKRPRLKDGAAFGFHEIFHIFVLIGSFFHTLFMFRLIPSHS